jgi:hypothetical protein
MKDDLAEKAAQRVWDKIDHAPSCGATRRELATIIREIYAGCLDKNRPGPRLDVESVMTDEPDKRCGTCRSSRQWQRLSVKLLCEAPRLDSESGVRELMFSNDGRNCPVWQAKNCNGVPDKR